MPDGTTCGLVAAAGKGSRAGLPYPKTLFMVQGQPILQRVVEALAPEVDGTVVIASPDGAPLIRRCLSDIGSDAEVAIQPEPLGMGHAVLCAEQSPRFMACEDVLLAWGDIPFLQAGTIAALAAVHREHGNDLTIATAMTEAAYTVVSRDGAGKVTGVVETREAGLAPAPGERDIGLFMFRREAMLDMLRRDLSGKFGKRTGEHGFLYVFAHLAAAGLKVEALLVASEIDLVSLNSMSDLEGYI